MSFGPPYTTRWSILSFKTYFHFLSIFSLDYFSNMPPKKRVNINQRKSKNNTKRSRTLESERIRNQDNRNNESVIQRDNRLDRMSNWLADLRSNEKNSDRETRLRSKSGNQNARLENESNTYRQARLRVLIDNQNDRLQNESDTDRQVRLGSLIDNQNNRLENESDTDRQARLSSLRSNQATRLANENQFARETRLRSLRSNQTSRLANETDEVRETRIGNIRTTQRQRRANARVMFYRLAVNANASEDDVDYFDCGDLTHRCSCCNSKNFQAELDVSEKEGRFRECCQKGKVSLPPLKPIPHILETLIKTDRNFGNFILNYNYAFAFASRIVSTDRIANGEYSMRIHGQVYHKFGGLRPNSGNRPTYAQLYIIGIDYYFLLFFIIFHHFSITYFNEFNLFIFS